MKRVSDENSVNDVEPTFIEVVTGFVRLIVALVSPAFAIAGVLTLAFQALGWLMSGDWVSFSALDVIRIVAYFTGAESGALWNWLFEPTIWVGVWEILNWLPASGFLIGLGVLVAGIGAACERVKNG